MASETVKNANAKRTKKTIKPPVTKQVTLSPGAKTKITTPTVQTPAAPRYTPGGLGANSLSQIAARNLQHTLMTGLDDKGNVVGQGTLERQKLLRLADIGANRQRAGQTNTEARQGIDNNFAARGLGRSGVIGIDRDKQRAAYESQLGDLDRSTDQTNLDYQDALNRENYDYSQAIAGFRQQGAAEDYQNWLQNNPDQGATNQPAPVAGPAPLPDWNTWLRTHPWAKTPAQQAVLRANYNALAAKRR